MSTYDAIETVNIDHNGAEYTVKFVGAGFIGVI